mmetsp:Transcript_45095/g.96265  ORF Transcript_45095/g.96265 Transcript_45095/m.96265 type:complete len:236 (-) Transcript_45095:60-767(-)
MPARSTRMPKAEPAGATDSAPTPLGTRSRLMEPSEETMYGNLKLCCATRPTVAIMATRPCFSSAARYWSNFAALTPVENPRGSQRVMPSLGSTKGNVAPTSPVQVPVAAGAAEERAPEEALPVLNRRRPSVSVVSTAAAATRPAASFPCRRRIEAASAPSAAKGKAMARVPVVGRFPLRGDTEPRRAPPPRAAPPWGAPGLVTKAMPLSRRVATAASTVALVLLCSMTIMSIYRH